jgi:hypothetical protein
MEQRPAGRTKPHDPSRQESLLGPPRSDDRGLDVDKDLVIPGDREDEAGPGAGPAYRGLAGRQQEAVREREGAADAVVDVVDPVSMGPPLARR